MNEVVAVPHIIFSLQGTKGRRIFIECFGPLDIKQAQKEAVQLSNIMKERLFSKKVKEPKIVKPFGVN